MDFKIDIIGTRAPHAEAKALLLFPKSIKGHNFVKKACRFIDLSQMIALVMVNKCMKFIRFASTHPKL